MRQQPPPGNVRVGADVLQTRVAPTLPFTRRSDAHPDELRSFFAILGAQRRDRHCANPCMQVDSIGERP